MHAAESVETRRQDMQPEERTESPGKRVDLGGKVSHGMCQLPAADC